MGERWTGLLGDNVRVANYRNKRTKLENIITSGRRGRSKEEKILEGVMASDIHKKRKEIGTPEKLKDKWFNHNTWKRYVGGKHRKEREWDYYLEKNIRMLSSKYWTICLWVTIRNLLNKNNLKAFLNLEIRDKYWS